MNALYYFCDVVTWGNAFVPVDLCEKVRNAAVALGYKVCTGALVKGSDTVIVYIA